MFSIWKSDFYFHFGNLMLAKYILSVYFIFFYELNTFVYLYYTLNRRKTIFGFDKNKKYVF